MFEFFLLCTFPEVNDWNSRAGGGGTPLDEIWSLALGVRITKRPAVFRIMGRRKRDALELSCMIVSTKCTNAFRKRKCSGWRTFPVKLVTKTQIIKDYRGLAITGRVKVDLGSWSPETGVTIGFDSSSWDGSDLFTFDHGGHIFATSKVVKAAEEADVHGLYFYPIDPKGTVFDSIWFYDHLKAEGKLK